jgi:hypothetical protein
MSADDSRRDVPVDETATGTLDVERTAEPFDAPPAPLEAVPASEGDSPLSTFIGPRVARRWGVESVFVRLVATGGIIGIAVALAAILGTQDVAFWIVGLVISLVSVILAAILWSSRTL